MDLNQAPLFFLGANSPNGFVSRFESVYEKDGSWRAYIIKGGPGTGKSTFMKKLASLAMQMGTEVQLAPCSSDPMSLDAVIMPSIRCCFMDGTAPHAIEPKYPGVVERVIELSACYSSDKLEKQAGDILKLYTENKQLHERAARYISAAGALINDSCKLALECTDVPKTMRFAAQMAKREIPVIPDKRGKEQQRFISGITPLGMVFYKSTLEKLTDKSIVIQDENGAVSRVIMSVVRTVALESGQDIITCLCPFAAEKKIDHIIIPALGLCFTTANSYHDREGTERRIHARRFTSAMALRLKKQRLSFNRRAARELIAGAAEVLGEAKACHDRLEKYYIDAMDYKELEKILEKISLELTERAF